MCDSVKCPKSNRCVLDCYHKNNHSYEEKYCNDLTGLCNIQCVNTLISDCTFFDEDFIIKE